MDIQKSKPKIVVLSGGVGTEREISLQSGRCVEQALCHSGYEVVFADVGPNNLEILDDKSIDVFFVALHGEFGEDGQLQQILEDKYLCYTGSDPNACRLAINKMAAKEHFATAGVDTPPAIEYTEEMNSEIFRNTFGTSDNKYVVKPITHGSSVGIEITTGAETAVELAEKCKSKFSNCMIEKFIPGREITVTVLNGQPLPILEIRPKTGFYDYKAKYIDEATDYLFDTITDTELVNKISRSAVRCFECLGCRHVVRVDFILSDDGTAYALEVNTIPGMTTHSCVPKAAGKIGLSMSDLCKEIVETALADFQKEKNVHSILSSEKWQREEKQRKPQAGRLA